MASGAAVQRLSSILDPNPIVKMQVTGLFLAESVESMGDLYWLADGTARWKQLGITSGQGTMHAIQLTSTPWRSLLMCSY